MFSLKKYDLGEIQEIEVGWKGQSIPGRRGRVSPPTPEQIKRWNHRQKVKKYARLIECNFTQGDSWVCFKYKAGTRKPFYEVIKDFARCRRKIRDIYRAAGQPFKYLYRLEYGKNAGVHIHMICNHLDGVNNIQALQNAWLTSIQQVERSHGAVDIEALTGAGGYDSLAEYICKEPKVDEGGQLHLPIEGLEEKKALVRMHASRNLRYPEPERKPITKKEMVKILRDGPQASPGYEIIKDSVKMGRNPVTDMPYAYWKQRKIITQEEEQAKQIRKRKEPGILEKARGMVSKLFGRLRI